MVLVYSMVGQAELSPPPLLVENVVGVNRELEDCKIQTMLKDDLLLICTTGFFWLFPNYKGKSQGNENDV